jgi:hypothetical protein
MLRGNRIRQPQVANKERKAGFRPAKKVKSRTKDPVHCLAGLPDSAFGANIVIPLRFQSTDNKVKQVKQRLSK